MKRGTTARRVKEAIRAKEISSWRDLSVAVRKAANADQDDNAQDLLMRLGKLISDQGPRYQPGVYAEKLLRDSRLELSPKTKKVLRDVVSWSKSREA